MEYNNNTVVFVFFVGIMVCVHCLVDSVKVSIAPANNLINREPYSKVNSKETVMSTTIRQRSSRKRRFRKERRLIETADICADIVGAKWDMTKQGKSPCPELVVWVPKKSGFTEFVSVNKHNEVEGGFSIAIYCHALQLLPLPVQPIFKPFINDKGESNGTYDQLLKHIEGKTCQAVAGDVTIRGNRAEYVAFTIPYLSSEVYMLVHADHEWKQSLLTFIRPFTPRLWSALVSAYIITGVDIAFLEYRKHNPKFTGPFYRTIIMVMWFPISTVFFHEGRILNKRTKIVLVMWLCMIFIVLQIFTATLSSWLTLDQLYPRLPATIENAGYQNGSFLKDFIIQQYNCSGTNLIPLNTMEDFKNVLSNGSVNAVFDELPYIELYFAKYGSEYMKVGPIKQESGLAFAFPLESPLLQIFSRAVINVTESETMMDMKKKYLGFSSPDNSQPDKVLPQCLGVNSFIVLFIIMGIVIIATIISSEVIGDADTEENEQETVSVINYIVYMNIAAIISADIALRRRYIRNAVPQLVQVNIPD